MTIEESIHIAFDETNSLGPKEDVVDDIVENLTDIHLNDKVENLKKEEQ